MNAAAWMISTKCIKRVGGFDTQLFYHYGEDDNYCQRMRYHGFKLALSTRCSFCHDREFRQGHEKEYREKILQVNPFFRENLLYGDINRSYDFKSLKRQHFISLCLAFLSLSPSGVKKHKGMIRQLTRIHESRVANMAGGLVWL